MKLVVVSLIGLLFGAGILISGMADPNKVLNFFDILGTWDPSLAFVMGGALVVNLIGCQVRFLPRSKPLIADTFLTAAPTVIAAELVGGAMLFGVGWGIAGFCPGAAIPTLGSGEIAPVIFITALGFGMVAFRLIRPMLPVQEPVA